MSTEVWKLQELPGLCPPDIVRDVEVYVKAIKSKIERILFLVYRLSVEDKTLLLNSNFLEFRSFQLEVEIDVESIAVNLHSLADVLAQIINIIILKPLQSTSDHLTEKQISIYKVKEKLSRINLDSRDPRNLLRRNYINQIIEKIENLEASSEFKYISAFANTIKHRNLLDTEYFVRIENKTLMDIAFKFDSFIYQNYTFPSTECRSIIIDHRVEIINLVFRIGESINRYCRVVKAMTI